MSLSFIQRSAAGSRVRDRYGVCGIFINKAAIRAAVWVVCVLVLAAAPNTFAWGRTDIRLLVLGDSLAAGYGLSEPDAFPAQLETKLRERFKSVSVINGGVSGDTTAGGLARLDWSLADKPTHALVELGANDGLRGLDPKETQRNLDAIVARLKDRGIRVLIAGMLAPPNMGPEYGAEFNAVFPAVARKHGVPLYPFFLDGVAANPRLNQADRIHPNEAGVRIVVDRIAPYVIRLLQDDRRAAPPPRAGNGEK